MRRYIITGAILLALSMACEEKKKKRVVPAEPAPKEVVLSAPVEISLPSVETESKTVETAAAEKDKTAPVKPMKLAAKALPSSAPVKYEDVSQRVLEEGSRDEASAIGLEKIREKAQQRSKELQEAEDKAEADRLAEEAQAAKIKATAEAEAAAKATDISKVEEIELPSVEDNGTKVAVLDPEAANTAVSETVEDVKAPIAEEAVMKSGKVDSKTMKSLEAKFKKAQGLAKKGDVEGAKNLFLNACQSGHAHACHKFAWYEEQAGNTANASRFYRAACDNGLGKSCNNLAFQFEQSKVWDKALDLYAKGCMEKHEASCTSLKRIREEQLQENLQAR
ncbi:MAG: hypothetical protein EOP07_11110 [Proteobacteria bacterium]|nr:MAG: hypothetical protein EOP07_11110 [Pseudomonadota bacterium]